MFQEDLATGCGERKLPLKTENMTSTLKWVGLGYHVPDPWPVFRYPQTPVTIIVLLIVSQPTLIAAM